MGGDKGDGNNKNVSSHILPTSANLLGLCFVIFSVVKVKDFGAATLLDEMTAFSMVLFLVSSVLSYASIRSKTMEARLERIADGFFLGGLASMTLITLVFLFEVAR